MQYTDTLQSMIGYVRNMKPNAPAPLVKQFLNLRTRQIIDAKPNWAGLIKYTTINIPDAYTTGSVSFAADSTVVTGTSTSWPYNDIVNSTIPAGIVNTGLQWVVPASMDGITADTILYVDAAGSSPEVVAVTEVRPNSFRANFRFAHDASATLWCSRLSQRQLVIASSYPIFTVLAVKDATTLILDAKWGGAALATQAYNILKIYFTFATDIKEILSIVDPIQPLELAIHVPQRYIAARDPRREARSAPEMFVDRAPNLCGNMQYEIYPPQTGARQLNMMYYQQWPDMEAPGDRPPTFINPSVLMDGAVADAKRHKVEMNDVYYDPQVATYYEQRFLAGLGDAMNADNTKAQQQLEFNYRQMFGGSGRAQSGSYAQSHDIGDGW